MSLLTIVLVIVVVGVLLWVVNQKVPMDPTIKTILNATVAVVLVVWLLRVTGLMAAVAGVRL